MSRLPARLLPLAGAALLAAACAKAPTISSFTATPSDIHPDDPVTLAWVVSGADSLSLDNQIGDVTGKAQVSVNPHATATYTLTATSGGGSTTAKATVTVTVPPVPAKISGITATPPLVASGAAVTINWAATGVVSQSMDNGVPALQPTDTQVVVHPAQTTVYTLTVQGTAGTAADKASVTVWVPAAPAITSFTATPSTVAQGGAATLAWASEGTDFKVSDGTSTVDVGPLTSLRVRPAATTTYTLTAATAAATATKTVTVTVTAGAAAALAYTNPTPTTEAIKLVRNAASTATLLVLDVVANQDLSASALALNLPLDGDTAGSRDGSARVALDTAAASGLPAGWVTAAPGFDVDTGKLNPGGSATAPIAATAKIGSAGGLAGVLSLGIAQKPQAQCGASSATCVGAAGGDATLHAGDVLGHLRLALKPAGGAGTVFDPATFSAPVSGYRALVRGSASSSTSFAIGKLVAQ